MKIIKIFAAILILSFCHNFEPKTSFEELNCKYQSTSFMSSNKFYNHASKKIEKWNVPKGFLKGENLDCMNLEKEF